MVSVWPDEESALERSLRRPAVVDAVLVFDDAQAGMHSRHASQHGHRGMEGASLAQQLLRYRIRMNHTDIPQARMLFDIFDVDPTPYPIPNALNSYKE